MTTAAMVAVGVYVLALNLVIEMAKRFAVRREWTWVTGNLELWTLLIGAASGPVAAPWVWAQIAGKEAAPLALGPSIFVGLAAAALALSIYPVMMEPLLKQAGAHVSSRARE